jgi:hypothetical protein
MFGILPSVDPTNIINTSNLSFNTSSSSFPVLGLRILEILLNRFLHLRGLTNFSFILDGILKSFLGNPWEFMLSSNSPNVLCVWVNSVISGFFLILLEMIIIFYGSKEWIPKSFLWNAFLMMFFSYKIIKPSTQQKCIFFVSTVLLFYTFVAHNRMHIMKMFFINHKESRIFILLYLSVFTSHINHSLILYSEPLHDQTVSFKI